MSELEQLTALEMRLHREQIDLLMAMANGFQASPLAMDDLRRAAHVHSTLEAVRAEIEARMPREGHTT